MAFRDRIKDRIKRVMGRNPDPVPAPQPPRSAPEVRPDAPPAQAAPKPASAAPKPASAAPKPASAAPKPASAAPKPASAGAAPVGPVSRARPKGQRTPPPGAAPQTPTGKKPGAGKEISPDKMRKAVMRAKKGTMKFVKDAGGNSELADMHDHSERRYFVGHRAFSRLMEEITEEGLLHFDSGTGMSTMTEKGEAWIQENVKA
ncbi:MAG: hypothetical protein ACI9VR_002602 [Cognaticolwellia sp.]